MSTSVPKEQFAAYTQPTLTAEEYAALLVKHGQPRGLLCDRQIRELAEGGMITPFVNRLHRHRVWRWDGQEVDFTYDWENNILAEEEGEFTYIRAAERPYRVEPVISYGLSSFGYDLRIADEFRIFTPATGHLSVVNPKKLDERALVPHQGDVCIVPPNSFALARSVETFHIPDNVLVLVVGKSTYARAGVVVNVTPLEPGWRGQVTIEISNTTPLPVMIFANEGIGQCLFFAGERPAVTYADRQGKYQDQVGITLPRS